MILVDKPQFPSFLVNRAPESHKGTYGHALLVAGSYGKMGAAVLAARACLRAGVGLLTVHVPRRGVDIMQVAVPEAMVSIDAPLTSCNDTMPSPWGLAWGPIARRPCGLF